MYHSRLLALLNKEEVPDWFVKKLSWEINNSYGAEFREIAQRLWTEIRTGFSDQDWTQESNGHAGNGNQTRT